MLNLVVVIFITAGTHVPGVYREVREVEGKIYERYTVFTGKEYIGIDEFNPDVPNTPEWSDTAVLWVDRNHQYAVAENVRISDDGMYIVAGWWLNNERVSLYRTTGNEFPVWFYSTPTAQWQIYTGISQNGNSISAQSNGTPLYKWNKQNQIPEWTYEYTGGLIVAGRKTTAVSFDGTTVASIASGGATGRLFVFDAPTGNLLYTADFDPTNGLYGVDISDDGSVVCVTTYNMIYVYENGNLRETIPHYGQTDARIDGTGNHLVRGDFQGYVRVYEWNGSNYNLLWQAYIGGPWVTGVDISRDGSTIMAGTGYSNGTVYMWDISSSTPLWSYQNYGSYGAYIYEVALSGDGSRGIVASWGDTASTGNFYVITVHDKNSATPIIGVTRNQEPGSIFSCDISDDGTFATAGGKAVHAYVGGNGGEVYAIIVGSAPSLNVGTVSIDAPGKFIQLGQNIVPTATFTNYGDNPETFDVYFEIEDSTGLIYADTQSISNLPPMQTQQVQFLNWSPDHYDYYLTRAFTALPGDQYPGDDTISLKVKCFHDAAVSKIINPFDTLTINQSTPVRIEVFNNGSYTESFTVIAEIFDSSSNSVYIETLSTPNLSPETNYNANFSNFYPSYNGNYVISSITILTDDFDPSNDTLFKNFYSSYEIIYDNADPEAWYWVGSHDNDKFAVRFTPTLTPPFYVTGGRIMVNATYPFDYLIICEGTGLPDTANPIDTVYNVSASSAPGWALFTFDQPIQRNDTNDLWIVIHWPDNSPVLGVGADNTYPIDNRSFWYNNSQGWNAWINHDWMIRLSQQPGTDVEEKSISKEKFKVLITNILNKTLNVKLILPQKDKIKINLFDVAGRKNILYSGFVPEGTTEFRFDLRKNFNNGVYFIEMQGNKFRSMDKVVLIK